MLTYDESGKAYWRGERVPRTTEICAILAPRWPVDEYYKNKGRLIHLITELEDRNELNESSVDPALKGYLDAYRRFKRESGWVTMGQEMSFFHRGYKYCGRADRTGLFEGRHWDWVIDIKSGQPNEADTFQAPAYMFGLRNNGTEVQKCGDLYLRKNGF